MAHLKAFAKVIATCVALVFCATTASAQRVVNLTAEVKTELFGSAEVNVVNLGTDSLQAIGQFLVKQPAETVCLLTEDQWVEGDSLFVQRIFIGLKDKEARKLQKFVYTASELSPAEVTRREALADKIRTSSDKTTVSESVIAGGEARVGKVAYTVDDSGHENRENPIVLEAKNTYYWQIAPVVGINYSSAGEWTPYFGAELARWGERFGGYIQGKLGWAYYPETANNPGKSYLSGGAQMGLGVKLWNNQGKDKNLWIGAMVDAMWYQTDTKRPESDDEAWATHKGLGVGPGAFIKWRMPYFEMSLGYSYTRIVGLSTADWEHNVWATISVPFALWRNSTAK